LAEDEFKYKLQHSEAVNNDLKKHLDEFRIKLEQSGTGNSRLKKQLEAKDEVLKSNSDFLTLLVSCNAIQFIS
jgi:predicted phage gp36 major capsid-like protein